MTDHDHDWDGNERRAPVILAEQLRPKNTVEAPIVMVLVGFAALLLMQAAAIWNHGVIVQRQRESEQFRRQVSCYLVHTSQGETGTGVLTACGFIDLGGK
jgi:hypothetical protein